MSNEKIDVYSVVKKLIGPIDPVGETQADEQRYENLLATNNLVESLLGDIYGTSTYRNRHEYSMKKSGELAHEFLVDIGNVQDTQD